MNTRWNAHFSVGTLLRCITFAAIFIILAKAVHHTQEPMEQRSLLFCWLAMGVGAFLYVIILWSPRNYNIGKTKFRLRVVQPARRDQVTRIVWCMFLATAIVVCVSVFCIWIADNRRNRGPIPVSSTMFGLFAGFSAGGLLVNCGRQWVYFGEDGVAGLSSNCNWESIGSAHWLDKERGILRIVQISHSESPAESIDLEVHERTRDVIVQFLRTKTDFVSA